MISIHMMPIRSAVRVGLSRGYVRDSLASALRALAKTGLIFFMRAVGAVLTTLRRLMRTRRPAEPNAIRLMCLVDLVQDIDLILPIATAARASGRFKVEICQTNWLLTMSPRVKALLEAAGFNPILVSREAVYAGIKPDLSSVDALLMASESTAEPHRFSHALAIRANTEQVHTFVLQHGLENIGLTYLGPEGDYEFASRHILTWGDPRKLPGWVPETRRQRCIGVGTPKPVHDHTAAELRLPPGAAPIVGVFENLHWERYSPSYAANFLADLAAIIAARRDLLFVVKPHHAGRWLAMNPEALDRSAPNLVLINPVDPRWEPFTAGAIIEHAAAVITTPSTVALDAARTARPVAVAGYDLDLPVYAPLPILRRTVDWFGFLADALAPDRVKLRSRLQEFSGRHLVEGDACAAILAAIADDVVPRRAPVPSAHGQRP